MREDALMMRLCIANAELSQHLHCMDTGSSLRRFLFGDEMTFKKYRAKKPLPGTQRMRHAARQRHAEWQHDNLWLVTGGKNQHFVTAGIFNKPDTFTCDCGSSSHRELCCHILAVMWEM